MNEYKDSVDMSKIKVLHMTPPIINNGIYKYIFSNLKFINKERFQFDFLTQNKQGLKKTEEYGKYHFDIKSFSTTQRDDPQRFRYEIEQILSDNYDVLQLHTSFWRGFAIEEIAMELGIPKVIVHSHSTWIDKTNEKERNRLLQIHEEYKKKFSERYATHFWACSRKAADWLYGEHISPQKVQILPNAIEMDRFCYNLEKRNRMRKNLAVENNVVIGHTGRFEYQKNHAFLIKVFEKLYKKNPQVKLLLIGEGELLPEIKALVKDLQLEEAVIFLEWRNDVEDLLQAMDIYCLPSWFEGLPISLIEAQASGLYCFVSEMVSTEAKITENVEFLALEEELWFNRILELTNGYFRKDVSEQIAVAGYDIREQIKVLETLYER